MTSTEQVPPLPVVLTAAGRRRAGAGGFRYRHGWIPLDGSKNVKETGDQIANDRPSMGRGSEAVRAARSEARQRLDAALERLDKAQPEVARGRRARLNELRESGKLTPDRMRIETDAANRAALPSGHDRATGPGQALGHEKFEPGAKNRDGGNGGHGGTGADVKPKPAGKSSSSSGDSSVRGDSMAAKNARRAVFDLSGAGPEDRQAQLRKMSDVELRNAHEAVRAQHADAQGSHDKAGLKALSDDIRAEHTRRKQAKKSVTASGGPIVVVPSQRSLVAATAEDGSTVPDDYWSKSSNSGSSSKSSGGGKFSEDKHPRHPAGSGDKGGEFAPAGGAGKDEAGKKAQANKSAQANFLKLAGLNPADSKKFLAGLSEKDLTELTEIAYSAKTSDKKVVTQRNQISAEMTKRGISIQDHGARGGGLPKGAGKKPAPAKKAPAKKAVKASAGPIVHLGGDTTATTASAACEPPRVLVTIGGPQ